jgi:hypothetical protein
MFALTDLEICTIGLCATIVLCTIGLANSIYRDLRRTAIHISHQIWCSADFHSRRSDGRIADRLARLQTAVEAQDRGLAATKLP